MSQSTVHAHSSRCTCSSLTRRIGLGGGAGSGGGRDGGAKERGGVRGLEIERLGTLCCKHLSAPMCGCYMLDAVQKMGDKETTMRIAPTSVFASNVTLDNH